MRTVKTDVAVIGAGTAGLAAYRAAKAAGRSALLIESGVHGTTCARVGCMPSKLLIAPAEAAHAVERFAEFGLSGTVAVEGKAVMARVRRERDRFVGFVTHGVDTMPAADKLAGFARFTSDTTLDVGGTTVEAGAIVIATGSSPAYPSAWNELGDRLVTNESIFEWTDLPESVVVFGPGVIGLELGQALHRLGVRVRLFGRASGIGPLSDPQVRDYAMRVLQDELALEPDAQVQRIERTDEGVAIRYAHRDGSIATEIFDSVIAATGRVPNVRTLGLEHTTLALDRDGVPLFDRTTMQCGTSHIFIAGDVNNDVPLLHEAADEGRIAGENAAGYPDVRAGLRRTPLGIVFCDPQIATLGQRYADLAPGSHVTGTVSFEDQGRSRVMLRNKGLLHVYAEIGSGRIVGAEMIGPDAEHLAHLLAWAVQGRLTVAEALERPFYHPVVEEGLRTALRDAAAKLDAAAPTTRRAA